MKTYLYPQNLKSAASLWLWSLKDFVIISATTLLAALVLVNTGVFVPVVAVLLYAFVTIRLEEITIMDFVRYAVKFFITTQQYFEWRAGSARPQSAHRAPSFWARLPALKRGKPQR